MKILPLLLVVLLLLLLAVVEVEVEFACSAIFESLSRFPTLGRRRQDYRAIRGKRTAAAELQSGLRVLRQDKSWKRKV